MWQVDTASSSWRPGPPVGRRDSPRGRAAGSARRTTPSLVFAGRQSVSSSRPSILIEELTAAENVELPALLAGRSPRAARTPGAAELLEQVGLHRSRAPSAHRRCPAVSGSASRSPGRSATNPGSSSPTSQLATSTALPPWRCLRLLDAAACGRADARDRHPRRACRGDRRPADLDARRRLRRGDASVARQHRPARRAGRTGDLSKMGRLFLIARLAAADVRRHPVEAALLVIAITAATATLGACPRPT